jgi:FixJ family two-component response regulator
MPSRNVRVAIVDDDESFRRALQRLLTASGLEVEAFATGQGFLDSLQSRRPDCLLLDLQMPGLTGQDVQKALARLDVSFPTIVITARDDAEAREACLAGSAFRYFCKPVERTDLMEAIAAALGGGTGGA